MAIKKNGKSNDEVKYEVLEECGTISKRGNYELKLRYMSWNGKDPRYDVRPWKVDEDGNESCLKGVGLSGEELEALGELIQKMETED